MSFFQRLQARGLTLTACCVVAGGLIATLFGGCDSGEPNDNDGSDPVPEQTAMSIDSIFDSLHPERYRINVPADLPTTYLNNWGAENLEKLLGEGVDEDALKKKLSTLLSEKQLQRVLRKDFVVRDSVHLRDMTWARQLLHAIRVEGESDVAQVTRLFYYVNSLIRLNTESEVAIPLSPFDTALYGRGTAADRVWVYSCLMRQLGLPVLVVVQEKADSASAALVAGVVIDEEVYLFDFQLGLPISSTTSPPKKALPSLPATFKQVLADDGLLRAFDVEEITYPVTAETLKKSRLMIAGDSSVWARRMEAVQYALKGNVVPVTYEPLVGYGAFEEEGGVFEIVSEAVAGLVPEGSVGVWEYPEIRRDAAENLTKEQTAELNRMHEPMKAPRTYRQVPGAGNGGPKIVFGAGRQLQLQARLMQILGEPQKAISIYLKIQTSRRSAPKSDPQQAILPKLEEQLANNFPQDVLSLHERAAQTAMFWQATCQLQLNKLTAAGTDFSRWLINVRTPESMGQAALLTAVAFAQQGQFLSASGFLSRVPEGDPLYQTAQVLKARWDAIEAAE